VTRLWLLVLAALLILWQPVSFAFVASRAWPSLAVRGWLAVLELIAAGAVAAISAAAAWSLLTWQPHGIPLARLALVLSAARGVQSVYWTMLPSDVVPGTQVIYAIAFVALSTAWLIYLSRSPGADALGIKH
jgi:hypothetical protein